MQFFYYNDFPHLQTLFSSNLFWPYNLAVVDPLIYTWLFHGFVPTKTMHAEPITLIECNQQLLWWYSISNSIQSNIYGERCRCKMSPLYSKQHLWTTRQSKQHSINHETIGFFCLYCSSKAAKKNSNAQSDIQKVVSDNALKHMEAQLLVIMCS